MQKIIKIIKKWELRLVILMICSNIILLLLILDSKILNLEYFYLFNYLHFIYIYEK